MNAEQIIATEAEILAAKEQYLRSRWWERSCSFPDSRWRWCKEGMTLSLQEAFECESKFIAPDEENEEG